MQRVMAKASQDLVALQEKKCGKDPAVEWSDEKRAEKLKEIELKAASCGPGASSVHGPRSGQEEGDGGPFDTSASSPNGVGVPFHRPGFRAPGDTEHALLVYAMFKERVFMFCDAQIKGTIEVDSKATSGFPASGGNLRRLLGC
jgi:hypothetical protein